MSDPSASANLVEKKSTGRVESVATGKYLVLILSIRTRPIKNDNNPHCGKTFCRVEYKIIRAKPSSPDIHVLPGECFGISIFPGTNPGRMNTDMCRIIAACKTADLGETINEDMISVKKETRINEPNVYRFSIEEEVDANYVPKKPLILIRENVNSKDGSKIYPRHTFSAPDPETMVAFEAMIKKAADKEAAAEAAAAAALTKPAGAPIATHEPDF